MSIKLRRDRVVEGRHRTWQITDRLGTGPDDRWTVLGYPAPGGDNPAASYEDGQYPDLASAYGALSLAESLDDGSHMDEGKE